MKNTLLEPDALLPLTCTREGTCCHGKQVWINPWELDTLAAARSLSPLAFRQQFTDCGGIRLKFNGPPGFQRQPACSQYQPGLGCQVHQHRPLVCRLYPLGRERQRDRLRTVYQGRAFPCLQGCPSVTTLPRMTVAEYLEQQQIGPGEEAQTFYLDMAQEVADGAFSLLLETGLAASGDRTTLRRWRQLGKISAEARAQALPARWLQTLTLVEPDVPVATDPEPFVSLHKERLQAALQEGFGAPQSAEEMSQGSSTLFGLALQLAQSVGADAQALATHWISIARQQGARE